MSNKVRDKRETVGITYKETRALFDDRTGELHQEERIIKRRLPKEPDFIKLYLDDVMMLSDIPKQKSDILYLLLRKMNYDNEITIIGSIKKQISDELDCSLGTIDKALHLLVEKKVLIRKDRGLYIANPRLFGRGRWEDIEELRLSIEYKRDGKKIGAIVEKKDEMLELPPMKDE